MSGKPIYRLFFFAILWLSTSLNLIAQKIEPDSTSTSSSFLTSEVYYVAKDSTRIDLQNRKVLLYHQAQVNYEDIELQAEHIILNWNDNTVYAIGMPDSLGKIIGEPIFKEGDKTYHCESILYNFTTKKGKIKGMKTQDGDGYIHGDELKKNTDNSMYVQHSKYTTCSHDEPHFYINAKRLKIIPNDKIVSGPANLVIADIPTPLFIPFGFFPIQDEQSSGFIMPTYGYSINRGYNLTNGGWYFSINDYTDLALRGDIFTLGSWRLNAQSTYKKRYAYQGNFSLSYSKNLLGERGLPNFEDRRDFFINWTHTQDSKAHPNKRFSAKVNAGSSSYNQLNSTLSNNYLKNTLNSNISYSYSWPDKPFNLTSNIRHSQNTLNNSLSLSLPDVAFSMTRINPFERKKASGKQKWYEKITIAYNANAKNQIQTIDSLLFTRQTLNNMRYGIQHKIPITSSFKVLKHINFSPSANYTERWYFKRTEKSWNEEGLNVDENTTNGMYAVRDFNTSLRFNTRFFGTYSFKSEKIKALRHVVSPSISLTYRPDFSDEKWGYYDSNQIDTLGNEQTYSYYSQGIFGTAPSGQSGNISFNLDNNIEIKVREKNDSIAEFKKITVFRNLNFRTSYNLAADSFKLSNFSFNGRTELIPKMNIKFNGSINPYQLNEQGIRIHQYAWKNKFSLGRLTNFNFSINWRLKNSEKSVAQQRPENTSDGAWNMIQNNLDDYVDFNVPWDVGLNYSYNYNKPIFEKSVRQTFNFSGNVRLTEKWKIGFHSGYDFDTKDLSYTSLDFYRDLHCWELRFNWIPFGFQQSYNLSIAVKSAVLQDLKLNKQKSFYDFQ